MTPPQQLEQDFMNPVSIRLLITAEQKANAKAAAEEWRVKLLDWKIPTVEEALTVFAYPRATGCRRCQKIKPGAYLTRLSISSSRGRQPTPHRSEHAGAEALEPATSRRTRSKAKNIVETVHSSYLRIRKAGPVNRGVTAFIKGKAVLKLGGIDICIRRRRHCC